MIEHDAIRQRIQERKDARSKEAPVGLGESRSTDVAHLTEPPSNEQDVMLQRIQEWKDAHKDVPRELDFGFFCEIIEKVNNSSAVKVARNPTTVDGDWIHGAECINVARAIVDERGRLALQLRRDREEMSAERLIEQVDRLKEQVDGKSSAVMVQISEDREIQITDAYSHSLVSDHWAGLPFDLVFAYFDDARPGNDEVESEA